MLKIASTRETVKKSQCSMLHAHMDERRAPP